MERVVRLYPPFKVKGQSFKGVKRQVVPNQSLSLREIVKRFVRREQLPVNHEGLYEERFGDLEKISKQDIVEQMQRVEELKSQIKAFNKRVRDKEAKDAADKLELEKQEFERRVADSIKAKEGNPDQKSSPTGAVTGNF